MATNRDIAVKVIAHLEHLGEELEGVFLPDIVRLIPDTIREIVIGVAAAGLPEERKLFTKDFSLPVVAVADDFDTVDLSASYVAADAMLLNLPFPRVTNGSKATDNFIELLWTADKANLDLVTPSDGFNYYAVDDKTLFINAEPELTGNVVIRSFYVPAITNLPRQFEGTLIARLAEKLQTMRA